MIGGDRMDELAKWMQATIQGAARVPAYERVAPRNKDQTVIAPPFVVYSDFPRPPDTEGGEWAIDLYVDVWGYGGWQTAYDVAKRVDDALDGTAYNATCGTVCADRNGVVFQRMERDPDDEEIRRLTSQYVLRFNPRTY